MAVLGLFLLPVIGIWQVISAMYNKMSCEDSFLKKYLNIYWALTVPIIIISLLQHAELMGANNILIGTIVFSLIIYFICISNIVFCIKKFFLAIT